MSPSNPHCPRSSDAPTCSLDWWTMRCHRSLLVIKLASTSRFHGPKQGPWTLSFPNTMALLSSAQALSASLCPSPKHQNFDELHMSPAGLGTKICPRHFLLPSLGTVSPTPHRTSVSAGCTTPVTPTAFVLCLPLTSLLFPSGQKGNIPHCFLSPILSSNYTWHVIINQVLC